VVKESVVAVFLASAMLRHQERRVRHALHAASDDDIGFVGKERLARHGDSLQARAAHFVERYGFSGRLTLARGQDVTHDDLIGRVGPGFGERGFHGDGAELRRRE
jgi:hypothetical protein